MILPFVIEDGIITVAASDVQHIHDLAATFEAALEDPAWDGSLQVIVDVGDSNFLPDPEGLRELAGFFGENRGRIGSRRALVVSGEAGMNMGSLAGVFAKRYGQEMRPFRTVSEAREWLLEGT